MPKKQTPIQLLTELLKKYVPAEERDDVTLDDDSVYAWFYFDNLTDPADLEAAWGVFKEQAEIRRRLAEVEKAAKVIPGFGYRTPNNKQKPDAKEVGALVKEHLTKIRPLIIDREENEALLAALDAGVRVALAPPDVKMPKADDNELFMALYEGMQEPTYSIFDRGEHYHMLLEWATYLTKCDENILYLLWPVLDISRKLPADTADAGMRLWALHCRDRFWFKDNDPSTRIVYIRLPGGKKKAAKKKTVKVKKKAAKKAKSEKPARKKKSKKAKR